MNDRRLRFKGKRYRLRYGQDDTFGEPSSSRSESMPPPPQPGTEGAEVPVRERPVRERPPPHLKGKQIGLWYRDKNRLKQKQEKKEKLARAIRLEISSDKVLHIKRILGNLKLSAEFRDPQARPTAGTSDDKYRNIEESDFKHRFVKSVTGSLENKIKEGVHYCSLKKSEELDEKYNKELINKLEKDKKYNELLKFRKKLPAYDKRKDITKALELTNAILISGETGCGKTTQVPQFILDDEILAGNGSNCHIICTQPRRISAISVAERVAAERAEPLGTSVGYQIRLEKVLPRERASILFCTTGVLLQFMHGDPMLTCASHVIIDEVHERDTLSDFVITLLRDILPVRPDLKVILMSATLNAEKFSNYFSKCPTVHIPGFTFPVTEYYLEDVLQITGFRIKNTKKEPKEKKIERQCIMPFIRNLEHNRKYDRHVVESLYNWESEEINLDLICVLVQNICNGSPNEEAILVFLPGWDKISKLNRMLLEDYHFSSSRFLIIPLHSLMPTVTQRSVFDRPPPGIRKIVIATNIAETSITIDDIVHVIDCGKIKMKNFDVDSNISTLTEEWVSIANARQRRGRAGRVQDGYCYHLFTRGREMMLPSFQLPEIMRTRLEEVILQMKILQLGKAAPFLTKVLDPPDPKSVELSLKLLAGMQALDDDEDLTPLGFHLANLPVDPHAGKMLLLGAMFSCFEPISSIAARFAFKDPFLIPIGKEGEVQQRKLDICGGLKSDHLLVSEVMSLWENAESYGSGREFVRRNFLSYQTLAFLKDMKCQFAKQLFEMRFLPEPVAKNRISNLNSNRPGLVKAIVAAGLYPNIAIIRKIRKIKNSANVRFSLFTPEDGKVSLHPKSVNSNLCQRSDFISRYFVYFEKIKSSAIFLHDTTLIPPLALLFFCQNLSVSDEEVGDKILTVNNQIRFACSPETAQLILDLRRGLNWILEYKIAHPGVSDLSTDRNDMESRILRAIIELITIEDEEANYDDWDRNSDCADSDF